MTSPKPKLEKLLSESTYLHRHTFTTPGIEGLEIRFCDIPRNWLGIIVEEIGEQLVTLGFDPVPAVGKRIAGLALTGAEYLADEEAVDALTAEKNILLGQTIGDGFNALICAIVGGWNLDAPFTRATLLQLLERYPSLARAIYDLAYTATLSAIDKTPTRPSWRKGSGRIIQ